MLSGDAQNAFAPVIDWLSILSVLQLAGEDSPREEISCKFVQGPEILGNRGRQMENSDDWTDDEKRLIAQKIKRHLHAKGISRKELERPDLHESTINKALSGHFSPATLVKLEAILQTCFQSGDEAAVRDSAPEELGGYSFRSVERLQGDYLFIRCAFSNHSIITVYVIEIIWDDARPSLIFRELSRPDSKHTQSGHVYISFGQPFINLVTIAKGSVRSIITSWPDKSEPGKGVMVTLHNPMGATYIPAVSPAVLCPIDDRSAVRSRLVNPDDPDYDEYRDLLASVATDQYGIIIPGPSPNDRRRGMTIVGTA